MAKLHENLAVEKTLQTTANKLIGESIKTLGKENLFQGMVKNFEYFDSNLAEQSTSDVVKLESTVDENIDYIVPHVADWYDAVLQKDLTNQTAKGDIILPCGKVLAESVPATFLLGLESKLTALREVYMRIPTLAPGIPWATDASNEKANVFHTPTPSKTFKTEKILDFQVVVEPTEHHPAQIKEVMKVSNVGSYLTTKTSGMMPPAEKARRIDNLDTLLVAVRKARTRANSATLISGHIGKTLLDFINK